jgi:hypothetical protein
MGPPRRLRGQSLGIHGEKALRRGLIIVGGAAVAAALSMSPAHADSRVVVRGLSFPADSATKLSIVGCEGVYARQPEPIATYVSRGPGPAGTRNFKYDLAGGNAVGSQSSVRSMAATTAAGLSVYAPGGSAGVAYAGYQSPDDWATKRVWVGRASLTAPAGAWKQVDATGLTYTWTQYDLGTLQPVGQADGAATVPAFLAAHGGDGPGFYATGFGCDGQPFKIDALRSGSAGAVTTYDLEGFTTTAGITGSATSITAGESVTIGGVVRDQWARALPHGLLVLEEQKFGTGEFVPVEGVAAVLGAGDPSVTVQPEAHTVYRWSFAGTWSFDGSVSEPFTVDVGTAVTATPERVADSDALVVSGSVTPAKPGIRATLWRVEGEDQVMVGGAPIAADGSYRVEVPEAQKTPGRYFVTVPAVSGNLAGTSAIQLVEGSR